MDPAGTVHAFYAAINAHDLMAMTRAYSEWGSFASPWGLTMQGRRDAAEHDRRWLEALPDLQVVLERVHTSGHTVVVEAVATGTHLAPLRVLGEARSPRGTRLRIPFCAIYTVDDGLIASAHLRYDQMALLDQLEASPEPMEDLNRPA